MHTLFGVPLDRFTNFDNIPLQQIRVWMDFFNALPFKIAYKEGAEYSIRADRDTVVVKAAKGTLEIKLEKYAMDNFDCSIHGVKENSVVFVVQKKAQVEPKAKYIEFVVASYAQEKVARIEKNSYY